MALIAAKDLSVGYESHAVAGGITFEVNEGDYLCIVGENGAGKTTLMKTLLGLQDPVGGELAFSDGLSGSGIGYLPQQTVVQKDFPASVGEVVLSGCQGRKGLRPFYSREDKSLADMNLRKLGAEHLKNKCYRELSGGQQQRVLLARALCAADRIILLDEPAAGLDPATTADMYTAISDLNKEGMTVIMISHDMDAAVRFVGHILMVADDIFFGTTEEFLRSEQGMRFAGKGGRENA